MPITFQCPGCGKGFSVADNLAGRQAKCSACGATIAVPAASAPKAPAKPAAPKPAAPKAAPALDPNDPFAELPAATPAPKASKPAPRAAGASASAANDPFDDLPAAAAAPVRRPRPVEEPDEPPKKKKASAAAEAPGQGFKAQLIRGGLGLCVLGGLIFAFISITRENQGRRQNVVVGEQGATPATPLNETSALTPSGVAPSQLPSTPATPAQPAGVLPPAPEKFDTHLQAATELIQLMEAEWETLKQVQSDSAAETAALSLQDLVGRAAALGAAIPRLGSPSPEVEQALQPLMVRQQTVAKGLEAEVQRISGNRVWARILEPVTRKFAESMLGGDSRSVARITVSDRGPKAPANPLVHSHNVMKNLILAMHNYESAMRQMPTNQRDKDGKPLLSWRVQILPYIEQRALYDQFKFDEPWDSPHNLELAKTMPSSFASPQSKVAGEGKATYLMVKGTGTILEPMRISIDSIPDGSSNTAVLVEVSDDRAVFWTKPDDLELAPAEPLKGLTGLYPGRFLLGMADGTVLVLPDTIPPAMLQSLFVINDRGPIDRPPALPLQPPGGSP